MCILDHVVDKADSEFPDLYRITSDKDLNVREAPDINSEVVCVIKSGDIVVVKEKVCDVWSWVCTAFGIEGYAMLEFAEEG